MREICCTDKDCQILPSTQSSLDSEGVNTSSSAAVGLVTDSASMQVPLSTIAPRTRRKKKTTRKKRGKRGSGIVKRLQRLQIGGRRRRRGKKNQQGGSRRPKCVKRKR